MEASWGPDGARPYSVALSHPSGQISGNGLFPTGCCLLAAEAGVKPMEFEVSAQAALIRNHLI